MSYYYSWEDGFSTDPDWRENERNRDKTVEICCNGVEQKRVFCCLSGEQGFVKKAKVDSNGKVIVHNSGTVIEFHTGMVTVKWHLDC